MFNLFKISQLTNKKQTILLAVVGLLAGCNQVQPDMPLRVYNVQLFDTKNRLVLYELESREGSWFGFNKEHVNIVDSIGKYNIGDTLVLSKK